MKTAAFLPLVAVILLVRPVRAVTGDFYDETSLRTLQLEFEQPDWWSRLTANYQTKTNLPATLIVDGIVCEDVGVRFRGNTSYMTTGSSQKKSFNIEIDHTHEGQRLMGYKTLNLINCANDPTFMREVLYSNACRRQLPSAKANFVRLEINSQNWGIYANVQQLNAEFSEDWFPSNDGTRWRAEGNMGGGQMPGGNQPGGGGQTPDDGGRSRFGNAVLFEVGGAGVTTGLAALTWQGSDSAAYEAVYELKNTKQDDPWASLIHACDVLNNTPIDQLADVLGDVLDVDRALWLCAYEIIFQDDDGYVNKRGSDYGLYYEPETGRIHLMQYDGNECMGSGQWPLFYREDDAAVPLMRRLMAISLYRQRYLAHVRAILDSAFTEEAVSAKLETYRALIEEQVKADSKKLYSNQAFDSGIETLKSFVRTRRSSLLANRELSQVPPEILAVDVKVVQQGAGQNVTITTCVSDSVPVSGVALYLAEGPLERFRLLPMADDGLHDDGDVSDGVFGVVLGEYPIGTLLRYYVQATAADQTGTLTFDPAGAEHEVYTHLVTYPQAAYSPVVINELMASNASTIADPQGDYDDWIELLNVSDEVVDLSGMHLSDNPAKPLKWRFPDGIQLDPGEYLLVWADEDGGDEPGLHANFKLSRRGETVWLYDTDERGNQLLDSISFGAQYEDVSFGRYPDGFGPPHVLSVPTPLEANAAPVALDDLL